MKGDSTKVIALATDLTFHVSVATENSTTKDTTDTNGTWDENEATGISYDIQIGALVGAGDDTANTLEDIIDDVSDNVFRWELAMFSGPNNRTKGETIVSGYGKMTNVQVSAANRQNTTYTATLNGYGAYTVA